MFRTRRGACVCLCKQRDLKRSQSEPLGGSQRLAPIRKIRCCLLRLFKMKKGAAPAAPIHLRKGGDGSSLAPSRVLKNSFPPQFDSVPDSVGFRCVHGLEPT